MRVKSGFVLKMWDFDMDTESLGPVRCGHLDSGKKYAEWESRLRAGSVSGEELARDFFKAIARKRMGDSKIDEACGGEAFSDDQVALVTSSELDYFSEKLLSDRLGPFPEAPTRAEPDGAPERACDRLATALRERVEGERAASRKIWEQSQKSSSMSATDFAARDIASRAAFLTDPLGIKALMDHHATMSGLGAAHAASHVSAVDAERLKMLEETARAISATSPPGHFDLIQMNAAKAATESLATAFPGQSAADVANMFIARADGMAVSRQAEMLGLSAALGHLPDMGAIGAAGLGRVALSEHEALMRSIDVHSAGAGRIPSDAEATAIAAVSKHENEFAAEDFPRIIEAPPSFGQHFIDQGREIKKFHADVAEIRDGMKERAEQAKLQEEPKKDIERKNLFYAKTNMLLAFAAFVVPFAWGVWVYVDAKIDAHDAKIDAMESSKANAAEQKKLRDEIQALAQANKEDRDAFKAALAAERSKAADVQNASAKKGAAGRSPSSK